VTIPSSSKSYFDLHIIGLGYLNRVREVKPRKGDPFLACDIAALTGPKDGPEYRRFDVRVSGSDAQHLIRRCEQAVKAERKVLIGFRLGDPWTDIFTYTRGKNAGKQGVSLKARLLFVSWIKIDGEWVYKAECKAVDHADRVEGPATATASQDARTSESSSADPAAPAAGDSF
jgi:hypothetical protein